MRTPTPQVLRWLSPTAALAFGLLFMACADSPAGLDTAAVEPAFDHAGNHPSNPGAKRGRVTVAFVQQPTITPNDFDPARCDLHYSFEVEGFGPERSVRWSTYIVGGIFNIGSSTTTIGGQIGPVLLAPNLSLPEDGSTINLRVEITDDTREVLYAEALSDAATVTCPA